MPPTGSGCRSTHPRTLWRTSFTLSMVAAAVAFTIYRFRHGAGRATGIWNFAGLLAHIVLVVAAAFLCVYLDTLQMHKVLLPTDPRLRSRRRRAPSPP